MMEVFRKHQQTNKKTNHWNREHSNLAKSRRVLKQLKTLNHDRYLNEENYLKDCLFEMKKIQDIVQELTRYGFSVKKITNWMCLFLHKKKPFMKGIFINEVGPEKRMVAEHAKSFGEMKNNLMDIYTDAKLTQDEQTLTDLSYLSCDLKEFRHYLEDIFCNKNNSKLDELKESVEEKYKEITDNWNSNKLSIQPPFAMFTETPQFVNDLHRWEERYGEFQFISKLNRAKFNKLTETEDYIKNKYQQILSQ